MKDIEERWNEESSRGVEGPDDNWENPCPSNPALGSRRNFQSTCSSNGKGYPMSVVEGNQTPSLDADVTLGKLLTFSGPQFPHCKGRGMTVWVLRSLPALLCLFPWLPCSWYRCVASVLTLPSSAHGRQSESILGFPCWEWILPQNSPQHSTWPILLIRIHMQGELCHTYLVRLEEAFLSLSHCLSLSL